MNKNPEELFSKLLVLNNLENICNLPEFGNYNINEIFDAFYLAT
jgi:hypothetical protein